MAVSRISVAKGTHCHATMMPMENSGALVNQVMGSSPSERAK